MNSRRRADTHDQLDLHWRIDRQRRNPYRAPRMLPGIAEDLTQQQAGTVRYEGLFSEVRDACDVDRRLDNPGDHIKITSEIHDGCQCIERGYPGTFDGVVDRDLRADLTDGSQGAIHNRNLAGGIDQVVESHGRQIGRRRRNDRRQT